MAADRVDMPASSVREQDPVFDVELRGGADASLERSFAILWVDAVGERVGENRSELDVAVVQRVHLWGPCGCVESWIARPGPDLRESLGFAEFSERGLASRSAFLRSVMSWTSRDTPTDLAASRIGEIVTAASNSLPSRRR